MHQKMIFRQYQHCIGGFRHRQQAACLKSHHGAADKKYRIFDRDLPCLAHCLLNGASKRQPYRDRMLYLTHNGHQFIFHRPSQIYCFVDIVDRFHIEYGHTAFNGKAAGWKRLLGNFINQDNFVPGRIDLVQKSQPHLWVFPDAPVKSVYGSFICLFNADDRFLCPHTSCKHVESFRDFISVLLQQLPVQFQERFTLSAVHDNGVRPFIQFGIGGEPCTSCACNAALL